MESKFIYARTKAAFQRELPNIPENLNPIVFIEDSKEIWVLGQYFSMGSPGVIVSEEDNVITVSIGEAAFSMSTSGSLSIQKGTNNSIIFSSTALSTINTEFPLKWDSGNKKLTHEKSLVTSGSYGESTSLDDANIFNIPYLAIDKYGHVVSVENIPVKIRDHVEQVSSIGLIGDRNVLISSGISANSETGVTVKADGMTFNTESKKLTVIGGINAGETNINGNLTVIGGQIVGDVKGNITGTATPKIHLSALPEYGGASLTLYGHVKLEDFLGVTAPEPSSTNTDVGASTIERGVAASPKMVWDTKQELLGGIAALPIIKKLIVNDEEVTATELKGVLAIRTIGGIQAGINPETNEVTLKTPIFSAYTETIEYEEIRNKLVFTKDFELTGENLSIRWQEII